MCFFHLKIIFFYQNTRQLLQEIQIFFVIRSIICIENFGEKKLKNIPSVACFQYMYMIRKEQKQITLTHDLNAHKSNMGEKQYRNRLGH